MRLKNNMIKVETSVAPKKGTVIMLHGWAQNAKVMHHKSLTLTRYVAYIV